MTESDDLLPGSLRRSMHLYRAMRTPQAPATLRRLVAADSAAHIAQFHSLDGQVVLDVGAISGYLAEAVRAAGARFLGVSFPGTPSAAAVTHGSGPVATPAERGEPAAPPIPDVVLGAPTALPVHSGAVDVCYSADVLQQVGDPEHMAGEMVRVTRPGGLVFLCFVPWYSRSGGLETAPWHYFGGQYAARRYERTRGSAPANRFGENLFAVSVSRMMHWAHGRGDLASVQLVPRYYPSWATWVAHVPGLRELAVRNVALVLRVR